jgi:hypothetical protein
MTKALFVSLIAASLLQIASATDLTTYPTGLLGAQSSVAPTLPSGVLHCQFSGSFDYLSYRVEYNAQSRLVFDGIKDQDGFGHLLAGSSSFTTFRIGDVVPAYSCQRKVDLVDSKYTMNKRGQGITRITVLPNNSDPNYCTALAAQWTFLLDSAGKNAYLTVDDTSQNNGVAGHIGEGQCRRP